MASNGIIDKFKSKKARISYRESGRDCIVFGYIIKQTEDSLIVEPDGFENDIVLSKKLVTMIFWPKHRDDINTSQRRESRYSNLKPKRRRSKHFSYSLWWKDCNVEEAEP